MPIEPDSLETFCFQPKDLRSFLRVHFAVGFNVVPGGMFGVLGSLNMVAMREVSVMGGRFVVAILVMLRGFVVMARSVLVMFRCQGVMVRCFF
jgi:hypothetical protein